MGIRHSPHQTCKRVDFIQRFQYQRIAVDKKEISSHEIPDGSLDPARPEHHTFVRIK